MDYNTFIFHVQQSYFLLESLKMLLYPFIKQLKSCYTRIHSTQYQKGYQSY